MLIYPIYFSDTSNECKNELSRFIYPLRNKKFYERKKRLLIKNEFSKTNSFKISQW